MLTTVVHRDHHAAHPFGDARTRLKWTLIVLMAAYMIYALTTLWRDDPLTIGAGARWKQFTKVMGMAHRDAKEMHQQWWHGGDKPD